MTDMEPAGHPRKEAFGPGLMLAAAVILTAAVLFAIKHFVGGSSEESASVSPAAQNVFSQAKEETPDSPKPVLRSESSALGGNSLEMFTKTNAGYAGEEAPEEGGETAGTENKAREDAGGAAAAAAKTAAAKTQAAGRQQRASGTAIPKMQPVKGFGAAAQQGTGSLPSSLNGMKAGSGGMPDVSAILNSTKQEADRKMQENRKPTRK